MIAKIRLTVLNVVIATILCSYTPEQTASIHNYSWLLGKWTSPDGKYFETWEKRDDSTYLSRSYYIKGIDTTLAEITTLEQRGNNVYFIPVTQGQNDQKPVVFILTSTDPGELVFENRMHDFPQVITYKFVSADSIYAEISGFSKGHLKSIPYPFTRVK